MDPHVELNIFSGGHCTHPEAVMRRGGPWRGRRFPNAFALIVHPRHGPVLFDTGYSHHLRHHSRRLPFSLYRRLLPVQVRDEETAVARLRARGFAPADVKHVIVSHFHPDHVSALRDFPQATYWCTEEAFAAVGSRRGMDALSKGFIPGLLPPDFQSRARFLRPADRVASPFDDDGFSTCYDLFNDGSVLAAELPGHCHGQLGLWLTRLDGQRFFLIADAVWLRESFERLIWPRWPTRLVTHDTGQCRRTIERLHAFWQRHPDIAIVPSHCSDSLARWVAPESAADLHEAPGKVAHTKL